jgi:hypothetical protein
MLHTDGTLSVGIVVFRKTAGALIYLVICVY